MIKDLVNPTNFNLLVGKLGDVLIRALDLPPSNRIVIFTVSNESIS